MNDLTLELSREQTVLLTTMAHQYLLEGAWPVWQYVVSTLDGLDLDAEELIRSLPRVGSRGHIGPSYGLTSHVGHHLAEDDQPALTVAASLHVPELQPYVADPFLRVLQTLIQLQRSAPISTREVTKPQFGAADIEKEAPGLPRGFLDRLPGVLAWNQQRGVGPVARPRTASGGVSCAGRFASTGTSRPFRSTSRPPLGSSLPRLRKCFRPLPRLFRRRRRYPAWARTSARD